MTEELPHEPGLAMLVVPMPGSVRPPTDSAAAMIAWLSVHGAPRTAEVLRRLQRHAWAIEPPDPDAATQTELWATARFADVEQARAAARPYECLPCLAQPLPPAGAGPQLFGQLLAARLPVELILCLVGRPRLGEDLAGDPLVGEVRLAACVRIQLGAVDRHHPDAHQTRPRAEREHRTEQPAQRRLVAGEEAGDRRVLRGPVGGDHPVGDVLAAAALDRARRPLLGRIRIEHQRDQEGGGGGGRGGGGWG